MDSWGYDDDWALRRMSLTTRHSYVNWRDYDAAGMAGADVAKYALAEAVLRRGREHFRFGDVWVLKPGNCAQLIGRWKLLKRERERERE